MDRKLDISTIIKNHTEVVQNGRSEESAPIGSLERMMLKARRQGRKADAEAIGQFVDSMNKEISTFRKMSQIGRNIRQGGVSEWVKSLLPHKPEKPFSPRRMNNLVEKKLSPETPFLCFEGISIHQESGRSDLIAGPYFGILASNTSESIDLPQDTTLVFTFSRAATGRDIIELRVWKLETFSELFTGDSAETSTMGLLPNTNDQVSKEVSEKGLTIQDLFLSAADKMGRAALSKNPPKHVEDEWFKILREYGDTPDDGVSPS